MAIVEYAKIFSNVLRELYAQEMTSFELYRPADNQWKSD